MSRGSLVFVGAAALLTGLLLGHDQVPGGAGLILDTMSPWLALLIPVLALIAILCRCVAGAVAALAPLMAWAYLFGSWWAPFPAVHAAPATDSVRIVSQNLFASNGSPDATASALAATDADIVAVQEYAGTNRAAVQRVLDTAYPHHTEMGTVALWSKYPLSDTTAADVGLDWHRGLRTHIDTPAGDLVVYVVHLPSIRPWDTASRDHGLEVLSQELTADPAEHIVVAGDFNTASTDRNWTRFAPGYRHALDTPGAGSRFTWPATFPLARLDHILLRGASATDAAVLRIPGPDHRAVSAVISVDGR